MNSPKSCYKQTELTVGRGKDFISVPAPAAKFLFAGEFLRSLALEQGWVERAEKRG